MSDKKQSLRRNQPILGMRAFTTKGDSEYRHLYIQIERYTVMDACAEWKHQIAHSMSADGPKHWQEQMEEVVRLTGGSSLYLQDVGGSEFELIWQDDNRRRKDWYACQLEMGSVDSAKLKTVQRIFKGLENDIGARDMVAHLLSLGVRPVKYIRYGLWLLEDEFDVDTLCPDPMTLPHNQPQETEA